MATILDQQRKEIGALCQRYGVLKLELFGSAATDAFDPGRSDLDFVVEFDASQPKLFGRYFGLKAALETLFGRSVDLVMTGALKNRYFVAAVNKTRQLVYASEDAKAA